MKATKEIISTVNYVVIKINVVDEVRHIDSNFKLIKENITNYINLNYSSSDYSNSGIYFQQEFDIISALVLLHVSGIDSTSPTEINI